jgi:hypothetical protein
MSEQQQVKYLEMHCAIARSGVMNSTRVIKANSSDELIAWIRAMLAAGYVVTVAGLQEVGQ